MHLLQERLSSGQMSLSPLQMPSLSASWPPMGGVTSPGGLTSPGTDSLCGFVLLIGSCTSWLSVLISTEPCLSLPAQRHAAFLALRRGGGELPHGGGRHTWLLR